MIETQYRTIDGCKYVCTMMPATLANKTLITLLDLFGRPTIMAISGAFAGDEEKKNKKGKMTDDDIGTVIRLGVTSLFAKLDPENADGVIKNMLHGMRAEGEKDELCVDKIFDEHFRGRLQAMYQVVQFSLETNYKDFFDAAHSLGILSYLKAVTAALKAQTLTPKSGESVPQIKAEPSSA